MGAGLLYVGSNPLLGFAWYRGEGERERERERSRKLRHLFHFSGFPQKESKGRGSKQKSLILKSATVIELASRGISCPKKEIELLSQNEKHVGQTQYVELTLKLRI